MRLLRLLHLCALLTAVVARRVRFGVFLPSGNESNPYVGTQRAVRPIIERAVADASDRGLVPRGWAELVNPPIVRCDNSKDGVHPAIQFAAHTGGQLSAALGPICQYDLAFAYPVLSFYDIPVFTPTAFSFDTEEDQFANMIRFGPTNTEVVIFLEHIFEKYDWNKFFFGYLARSISAENHHEILDFCVPLGNTMRKQPDSSRLRTNSAETLKGDAKTWLQTHIRNEFGIVVMCAMGLEEAYVQAANELGMLKSGEYVFIFVDFSISVNEPSSRWDWAKDRPKGSVKIIRVGGATAPLDTFYDAVLLVAAAVNATPDMSQSQLHLALQKPLSIRGRNGNITIEDGRVTSKIALFDYDTDSKKFEELSWFRSLSHGGTEIRDVRNGTWVGEGPPPDTPRCGYDGSKCPGLKPWAITLFIIAGALIFFLLFSFFIYRHYKLESEIAAMTWRIEPDELVGLEAEKGRESGRGESADDALLDPLFHNAAAKKQSKAKLAAYSLVKPPRSSVVAALFEKGSQRPIFYKANRVAVQQLNLRRQKVELGREMLLELKQAKDVEQEHLVRFVGLVMESGGSLGGGVVLVSEWCGKGSLHSVLGAEGGVGLEPMMVRSLLHDLVKGLAFIHASDIRSHGRLSSHNCFLDTRFVLKLAGFGLPSLRAAELPTPLESDKYWHERLWVAPELLRLDNPPVEGTQKGDIYAFGIIIHEMLARQGPFGLKAETKLTEEEAVLGVSSGNGSFRPRWVGGGGWEEELGSLMVRCWSESAPARPDAVGLKKQFRALCREWESGGLVESLVGRLEQYAGNLEGLVAERTADYVEEKRKVEDLLHQLLPRSVAAQLIKGLEVQAEHFASVSIYFSDIVGFTAISSQSTPIQIVRMLNDLYTCFDELIDTFAVYKVETIGDAYMVVSGLPERISAQRAAAEISKMSLSLLKRVQSFRIHHQPEEKLNLRIGIHSGPVVAGVVGVKMPRYCLFGDTVNTASRMESNGLAQRIHLSTQTAELLEAEGGFHLELRGEMEMKGKGLQTTYWLHDHTPDKTTK